MFQRLIFLAVFGLIITPIYSRRYMKSVKLECSGNLKYILSNHTCRLKAINRFKSIGMMEAHIRDQLRNLSFNMALYVRNSANVFKPYLFNITENVCNWYVQRSPGAYGNMLMKVLKKFTNMNHTCPFTGAFIGKNLYLDMNMVPVPLPKNSYKFMVVFYEGIKNVLEHVGTVTYYMDLIETLN